MGISLQITNTKTLNEGYLLTTALSDLERGIAPLGPLAPTQPPLIGGGVAPPGRRTWPPAWGSSSRLLPRPRTMTIISTPVVRNPPEEME